MDMYCWIVIASRVFGIRMIMPKFNLYSGREPSWKFINKDRRLIMFHLENRLAYFLLTKWFH
jgi:hypothetical protein